MNAQARAGIGGQLQVSVSQYSDKGRKPGNQDCLGCVLPHNSQRERKGVAMAIADGISSSDVSHIASEIAVRNFLDDYYCTSDAWSVKKSAGKVLDAANSWLYSHSHNGHARYDKDKGYVCTFSALIIKAATAHIFHVGDSRIYRLNDQGLEQLTSDHRVWLSETENYLSRALGIETHCEVDYLCLPVEVNDIFILATDGVYEFVEQPALAAGIKAHEHNWEHAAQALAEHAYEQGSHDNLSIQLLRIDALPDWQSGELKQQAEALPLPPLPEENHHFDGYTIVRQIHASSRSHAYLAVDNDTGAKVVIKIPSLNLRGQPEYLERFLTEEWIARRIHSRYVLKAGKQERARQFLYTVTEYVEGKTLAQWLRDNPAPDIETVRQIIEQVARGLMAFHRMEMLHQDIRPENILIDALGTIRIIDFGSTCVAGLEENRTQDSSHPLRGTALYSAPEYFLGEAGTPRSDLFSLGVLTYHMLSGRFPYGAKVARCKTLREQRQLRYQTVLSAERSIPAWVDATLEKAVHPMPHHRYEDLSEFLYDLRHPNQAFLNRTRPPLVERNPIAFWQGVSLCLTAVIVWLLLKINS